MIAPPQRQRRKTDVIVDNTCLSHLADLNQEMHRRAPDLRFDCFRYMRIMFRRVHVPLKVTEELTKVPHLPFHQDVLDQALSGRTNIIVCRSFDPVITGILETGRIDGIDPGEAEAIAQSNKIGVRTFLTDDINCVNAMRGRFDNIRCISSAFLLAAMDLLDFLDPRDEIIAAFLRVYQRERNVSRATLLRNAYNDAGSHYTIPLDKRTIAEKCGIKRIQHLI